MSREPYILSPVLLLLLRTVLLLLGVALLVLGPAMLLLLVVPRPLFGLGVHINHLPRIDPITGLVLLGMGWCGRVGWCGRSAQTLLGEPAGNLLHQRLGVVNGHPVAIVQRDV